MDNKECTLFRYDCIKKKGLKPYEEIFLSYLIKSTFYRMKDKCDDVMFDNDGVVDWYAIEDEFRYHKIVICMTKDMGKFQEFIEDKLGISRREFYYIIKSLKEQGYISDDNVNNMELEISLYNDLYIDSNTFSNDKHKGACIVLNMPYKDIQDSGHYYKIYLKKELFGNPALLLFYSFLKSRYFSFVNDGKKFTESTTNIANDYGTKLKVTFKMITELKKLNLIHKDYGKEIIIL